jgi:outer membrane protein
MRATFLVILLYSVLLFGGRVSAQTTDSVWTLERCVQYALDHNISIQQNVLNERLAGLRLQQSRLSQLPNVSVSSSYGRSFGRSINPTTNQFVDGGYDFLSLGGNADVLLFGWFARRNTVAANELSVKATRAEVDQLRDDVSLNVATGFLRAVLAKEQIRVNERQVGLSEAQLDQTQKFVKAGRLPELNAAQLESQLATDSAGLITAIADYNAAVLDLKALLNLDFAKPFDVVAPEISPEGEMGLSPLAPEAIYMEAVRHFGSVRSARWRVEAAQRNTKVAEAGRLPQLSLSGQVGTNWASNYQNVVGFTPGGYAPSGQYFVPTSDTGSYAPVYSLTGTPIFRNVALDNQLRNNFRQTIALALNVPLFNAWQAQQGVRQARINTISAQLTQQQNELTLKQNVYKAHNDARNSWQKYLAARRAADAAERAYDFATKRYNIGLTSTVDYLVTQNNRFRAAASLQSAKYDLLFRLKVIDYYLGKELKL